MYVVTKRQKRSICASISHFFDVRFICQRPIVASVVIIWIIFIWSLIFMEDGARLCHIYWFVLLSRYQVELVWVSSRWQGGQRETWEQTTARMQGCVIWGESGPFSAGRQTMFKMSELRVGEDTTGAKWNKDDLAPTGVPPDRTIKK